MSTQSNLRVACVASVSSRVRRELLGREQKKKKGRGRGRGMKEPSPFCSRSNFRAVTRLETLATQANLRAAGRAICTR